MVRMRLWLELMVSGARLSHKLAHGDPQYAHSNIGAEIAFGRSFTRCWLLLLQEVAFAMITKS